MENTLAEDAPNPPGRKRRSNRKSSKTVYERRRRLKMIGLWLLIGLIGGIVVAGIAVMAGGSSG
jgi:hypothetical protein